MPNQKKPNIIVYLMDVQRYDNLGCYGYDKKTSPNIDKIAKDGIVFLNNISPAVWTLPSHTSLSTGKYVSGHGIDGSFSDRPHEKFTLAEVVKSAGYETAFACETFHSFARWGIDDQRGYDHHFLVASRKDYLKEDPKGSLRKSKFIIDWLTRRKKESPFFLFVNSHEPHDPYWPPEPFRKQFLPKGVDDARAEKTHWGGEAGHKYRMGEQKLTRKDWEIQKALYDGETATLDNRMGMIFDHLRNTDQLDNTMIMITSDHGDLQGEHDPHIEHQLHLYEPGIHTPMIVRYPASFPSGKVKNLVQTLDIFPTVMDVLGIRNKEVLAQLQGHSLLAAVDSPQREFAVSEYQKSIYMLLGIMNMDKDFARWSYSLKAIHTLDWKYIWSSNGMNELYDLRRQPLEKENLIAEHPERVYEMENQMVGFLSKLGYRDVGDSIPTGLLDDEEEKSLKAKVEKLKLLGFYREISTTTERKENQYRGYWDKTYTSKR